MADYKHIFRTVMKETFANISSFGSMIFVYCLALAFLFVDLNFGVIMLIGLVSLDIAGNLIKLILPKKRPDNEPYSNMIEKLHAGSFPSIHAARAAFLALLLNLYFKGIWFGVFIFIIALLVGASRKILDRHYFIDIFAGYVLGILVFLSIQASML